MARARKYRGPVYRFVTLTLKIMLLLVLLIILAVIGIFYYKYGDDILKLQAEAKEIVADSTVDSFRQSETSLVYDSKGNILSVLKGEKDSYYVTLDEIPQAVQDAMIASEDRKFYKHKGIDFKANIRAAIELAKHRQITQGGSTITQQLVKNVFLTQERTWERKIKEIFLAMELEKKYSKDQILEFYLNNIYFNNGYYGIEAAAKGYFNKSCSQLNLAQLSFLCAIPNNPNKYNPLTQFDNTMEHRNMILEQMYTEKKITDVEYSEALNQEIKLETEKTLKKRDYVETYVYYCATKALMEKQGFQFRYEFENDADKQNYIAAFNEQYAECNASLYSGGYRIYTSINKKKQKLLQEAVDATLEDSQEKNDEGIYKLQGAATCIDNKTGRVVAIVGGRTQKSKTYTLNRAFQSYRQPGSSFKPIAVYTPALERGYTPDTVVVDEKLDGKDAPKNSDGTYRGAITLRKAVENSINTVAWKVFQDITPKTGLSYVKNMHFSEIVSSDYVPAAALGGLTIGTNTVEMAGAYTTLENDGVYRETTCIKKITDAEGNILVSKNIYTERIYKENAAHMMVDMMQGVLKSGTGAGLGLSNMPAAAKTGTTDDKKDGWFCGFTPYFTTCVWVGFDMPQTLSNLYGATYPGTIWHNFMEQIHEGKEYVDFPGYEKKKSTKDEAKIKKDKATPKPDKDTDKDDKDKPEETAPAETPTPAPTDDWYDGDDGGDDGTGVIPDDTGDNADGGESTATATPEPAAPTEPPGAEKNPGDTGNTGDTGTGNTGSGADAAGGKTNSGNAE